MDYHWSRQNVSVANDAFGALTTEGAAFIIRRLDIFCVDMANSPFGAGLEAVTLQESSPITAFLAGTQWLKGYYQFAAATPGTDSEFSWDFGDEGLHLPSHTPFNEYRRFGLQGGVTAQGIVRCEMSFNFRFAYGMQGASVAYVQ